METDELLEVIVFSHYGAEESWTLQDSTDASQPRVLDDVTSSVDHLWPHNLLKFVDSGSQKEYSSVLST